MKKLQRIEENTIESKVKFVFEVYKHEYEKKLVDIFNLLKETNRDIIKFRYGRIPSNEAFIKILQDKELTRFMIRQSASANSETILGWGEVTKISDDCAELNSLILPEYIGKGIGKELFGIMVGFAREVLKVKSVKMLVQNGNDVALKHSAKLTKQLGGKYIIQIIIKKLYLKYL